MGTEINVGSENGSKLGKDIGVNIVQKLELNHKAVNRGHIHIQVQFHGNENLSICQWVDIGQVQGDV